MSKYEALKSEIWNNFQCIYLNNTFEYYYSAKLRSLFLTFYYSLHFAFLFYFLFLFLRVFFADLDRACRRLRILAKILDYNFMDGLSSNVRALAEFCNIPFRSLSQHTKLKYVYQAFERCSGRFKRPSRIEDENSILNCF